MKPILVLRRGDAASTRIADWLKRNSVTSARVYYDRDAISDPEMLRIITAEFRGDAAVPQLRTQTAWVQGEQAIKDALWQAQQTPKEDLIAYVSRTCAACQTFLRLLSSQPKLLARTHLREIEKDPRWVLEMHDMKAFKTPTLVMNTAQGKQIFQGQQALMKLVELS